MEDAMANTILKELREFRAENNKRWDENDKRWDENDKRWDENDKRWEENDKRWEENDKRWEENDRRWEQNEKRWEENDRRWEQNEKRWEENDRRWEQNEKRWEENNKRWDENTINLAGINQRLTALEEGRKKDKKEIIEVLDTMQKSIDKQFTEIREYFDAKFEKVYAVQRVHEVENEQFKKILYAYEKRFNFHNSRLNYLEQWKEQFDMGQFETV